MKSIVLKFGLISGGIVSGMMAVMMPLCLSGRVHLDNAEVVGYTSMVLSFLAVFFGIRAYRESAGGTITFGKAFQVGILITVVASVIYVATWQVIYYNFIPDFEERFTALTLEKMRADGATAAELAARQQEMTTFMELYKNPLVNIGMTFLEIFPVGLILTLISAAILRRRTPAAPAPAAAMG